MLSRFHLIPKRNKQTDDGQTDTFAISISRVNMLTRDNDVMSIFKMADFSHLGF